MGRERRVRKSVNYAEPKLNTWVFDAFEFSACSLIRASLLTARCASLIPCIHRRSGHPQPLNP